MTPTERDKIIHAYVEPGKCWHTWKSHPKRELAYQGWYKCERCGKERIAHVIPPHFPNPTYTDDAPFSAFLKKLFGEERMWFVFRYYSVCRWMQEDTQLYYDNGEARFELWLFHPDYRARFLDLFIGFLGLPETQRDWGWEECPECGGSGSTANPDWACMKCNGTGQVPRPWLKVQLKMMKEAENGE